MKLSHTAVIHYLAKISGSLLGFIALVYFARVLGEEILGIWGLAIATASLVSVFGRAGISKAVNKRISEGNHQSEYYVSGVITIGLIFLFLALAIYLLKDMINQYIGAPVHLFVIALAGTSLLLSLTRSALKGFRLVHIDASLIFIRQLSRRVTEISLVILGFGLFSLFIGYIVSGMFVVLIGTAIIRPNVVAPTKNHIMNIVNFAKFAWLGNIRKEAFNQVDILALGLFVAPQLVGIYFVAYQVANFLARFSGSIRVTIFPEVSKLSAAEDKQPASQIIQNAITYNGIILIPGIVGSFVLGEDLLRIFGGSFHKGVLAFQILMVAILLYTYSIQFTDSLNAIDRPDLAFRVNLIFIVSNGAMNLILAYLYGLAGAAFASMLSASIAAVYSYKHLTNQMEIDFPTKEIGFQVSSSIVMGGVLIALVYSPLGELYLNRSPIFVAIPIAIGGVSYFLSLILLSQNFRSSLVSNLPNYY